MFSFDLDGVPGVLFCNMLLISCFGGCFLLIEMLYPVFCLAYHFDSNGFVYITAGCGGCNNYQVCLLAINTGLPQNLHCYHNVEVPHVQSLASLPTLVPLVHSVA